ncbi:DUF6093 family protein [Microbacterium sp.]|uniref:DUF6093 family protein n=1 Tax=Microbacterium sp. TaxID=51671 RepID=UPI0039E5826B
MALSRPKHLSADSWPDEIAAVARGQFNGTITIRRPGTPGGYDPITGDRFPDAPGEIVLGPRPARAQHLRAPRVVSDGNGSQTSITYQFQCDLLPGDASITKGLVVTFDGGRDPELAKMTFQVEFATNSSHAAVRTIDCSTEGGRNA